MPESGLDPRLRELLRRGDPAEDGSAPATEEVVELRRTMMGTLRTARPTNWLPLAAAVAVALLAAILLFPARRSGLDSGNPAGRRASDRADEAPRQVRFATERGTQIIWVLDPDLDL